MFEPLLAVRSYIDFFGIPIFLDTLPYYITAIVLILIAVVAFVVAGLSHEKRDN